MIEKSAALQEAAKGLGVELYRDIKLWLSSLGSSLKRLVSNSQVQRFETPASLLDAIRSGTVKDGERVVLTCKPSQFGPFLRTHFLPASVGMNTSMRLGPRLNMGPMTNVHALMTHLMPVGLFPVLPGSVSQVCLYPSDTPAAGLVGMLPGLDSVVQYLPALFASRHLSKCHMPCHVTGVIRMIDADALHQAGHSVEAFEEIRQQGTNWVFDATGDDSSCVSLSEGVIGEFWGGLYACGHLELEGSPKVESVVEVLAGAISTPDSPAAVIQNQAGAREILVYGRGIRACLGSGLPVFSIHMDAEIGFEFAKSRARFDGVCNAVLGGIEEVCNRESATLLNPNDMDFTYTDGAQAYSVLRSAAAENVRDPVLIAIRDWHRKRSEKTQP